MLIWQHNAVPVKSNYFVKNQKRNPACHANSSRMILSRERYYPNVAIPTASLQDTGATKKGRAAILLAKQLSVKRETKRKGIIKRPEPA